MMYTLKRQHSQFLPSLNPRKHENYQTMWQTRTIKSRETGETLEYRVKSAPINVGDSMEGMSLSLPSISHSRPIGSEYSVMSTQFSDIKKAKNRNRKESFESKYSNDSVFCSKDAIKRKNDYINIGIAKISQFTEESIEVKKKSFQTKQFGNIYDLYSIHSSTSYRKNAVKPVPIIIEPEPEPEPEPEEIPTREKLKSVMMKLKFGRRKLSLPGVDNSKNGGNLLFNMKKEDPVLAKALGNRRHSSLPTFLMQVTPPKANNGADFPRSTTIPIGKAAVIPEAE